MTTDKQRNFFVRVRHDGGEVNREWLEARALAIENALIAECRGVVLGPSVTADFAHNGFEIDFTASATGLAAAYDALGRVMAVVEAAAGIEIQADTDRIRTDWTAPDTGELLPA